jgi:phosphonate transport system substrate-binding protein
MAMMAKQRLFLNRRFLAALACITTLAMEPAYGLDARYTDTDGDLVADVPSTTVDPQTLVFAYTPGEDATRHEAVWEKFMRHMEKVTGKRVRFHEVRSNAVQIEAMRSGQLHVGGFGTGSIPIAVNCAGLVPFAIMGGEKGILGYEMEIITYPGSGIRTPADLKGRKLAFTHPTSNSGHKLPSVLLRHEFKLEPEHYTAVFSGTHENSVLGVTRKDYDAAAIANEVMHRMMARKLVTRDQIVTVYKSETFPTAGFGLAHNLRPALATKVREAFFTFSWSGTELEKEFSSLGVSKFMPITYKKDWEFVRKVDAAMNVSYACK